MDAEKMLEIIETRAWFPKKKPIRKPFIVGNELRIGR